MERMVQGMSNNDITGDRLVSKPSTTYAENYDRIWGKKEFFNEDCLKREIERIENLPKDKHDYPNRLASLKQRLADRDNID